MAKEVLIVNEGTGQIVRSETLPEKYSLIENFGTEVLGNTPEENEISNKLINFKYKKEDKRPLVKPGQSTYGECHVCGSPMPLYLGLKNKKPWYFYSCPSCGKLWRYE